MNVKTLNKVDCPLSGERERERERGEREKAKSHKICLDWTHFSDRQIQEHNVIFRPKKGILPKIRTSCCFILIIKAFINLCVFLFHRTVQYLSLFCEAFSWTILDSSRFPLFHSGQVFHQLVCPLTVVLPQIFFNLTTLFSLSKFSPFVAQIKT